MIYVNGVEIGRENLPATGLITFGTTATGTTDDGNDWHDISFDPSLLVAGNNTFAVEVHQARAISSDITFDSELIVTALTAPAATITLNSSANIQARTLSDGQWSAVSEATFVIPVAQADLRISEIHFNPAVPTAAEVTAGFTDNDEFEFIELYNPSTTGTINLSGVQLSDGMTFSFGDEDLLPGERAVVVENVDAFMERYGDGVRVLGQWSGALSNGGEEVALLDSGMNEIMSVNYGDNDPWYSLADGEGFSLVLDDPVGTPTAELGKYYSWRSGAEFGGTPGTASASPSGVVINEILAHSDAPQGDKIELYNPTTQAIDVGFWYSRLSLGF